MGYMVMVLVMFIELNNYEKCITVGFGPTSLAKKASAFPVRRRDHV